MKNVLMVLCMVVSLFTSASALACKYSTSDLFRASPLVVAPEDKLIPLNGKIFVLSGYKLTITDASGAPVEATINPGSWSSLLDEYTPTKGWRAGDKINVQSESDGALIELTVAGSNDEEAPAIPTLSKGHHPALIKIAGEGLFYLIEDESGPIAATKSFYYAYGDEGKYRAIAVDSAGNRSAPSEWISASGKSPCQTLGCSSTPGPSGLSLLAIALLGLSRRRQALKKAIEFLDHSNGATTSNG